MSKWEIVQCDRDHETRRLRVVGGWLYLVNEMGDFGAILFQHAVFVPNNRPTKQQRVGGGNALRVSLSADDLHELKRRA